MLKLCFFVPENEAENVKDALFKSGAGRMGNYDSCCFQSRGIGQFRPLKGAKPYIGKIGELMILPEVKIELLCPEDQIKDIIIILKTIHPYEDPAYEVFQILDF